jgi:hypothetical protein
MRYPSVGVHASRINLPSPKVVFSVHIAVVASRVAGTGTSDVAAVDARTRFAVGAMVQFPSRFLPLQKYKPLPKHQVVSRHDEIKIGLKNLTHTDSFIDVGDSMSPRSVRMRSVD